VTLTEQQLRIIDLIEEGYVRWKIAQELDVSEQRVRVMIRDLCARYDCPMRDLPEAVKEAA
jgi:DNA-binding NarL/FixJ family response regulator